ncbi:MAG: prolipoprotein diacylglyceryl transferase, partial [Clostridia bacterium]|nr:prolipoprotein diacylglyceryl transferase [Clostridia bacterium]
VGRWGNFMNVEAYGGLTALPWRMCSTSIAQELWWNGIIESETAYQAILDGTIGVHPTFLYESLWCLLGFVLLHIISKKAYSFKGELFSLYLIWYGAGRFCIESLRTDSLYLGTMKVSQLVAVLAMIGGIVTFIIRRNRSRETSKDLFAGESTLTLDSDIAENVTEEAMEEAVEELDEAPVEEILVEESTEAPVEEPAVEELAETSDTDKE